MFTAMTTNNLKRTVWFSGSVLLAICLAAPFASASAVATTDTPRTNEIAAVVATPIENLEQKWGIQFSGLFLSAGGNMVDFRYKVVDPAKAAFLTKPETKPELLNQATGAKLIVPNSTEVGPLRQTSRPYIAGKLYFLMFANTRHHVKSGDKVTISAGGLKVENLIVE